MIQERKYSIQSHHDSEQEGLTYIRGNMHVNKAYVHSLGKIGTDKAGQLLIEYKEKYQQYRKAWRNNPQDAIKHSLHHDSFQQSGFLPLCVDIETAAICDLACQFCFRQWIVTPDKLMHKKLYYAIIDQCAELGVPSIKLNWRGEPLLHPLLSEFIDYAKKAGILETIINTNAVTLDKAKSKALIKSGLDLMIYSFDGGTKETYEKMRVGRFKKNRFEQVYENIRRFARIRREMGAAYPRTKIQMILTEDTFPEQDCFFELFSDCVDDVSVKAYSERGGRLSDLDEQIQKVLGNYLQERGIPKSAAHWRDLDGNLFISTGRLPCEQIYQRLVVTYDGRVNMCCYDWGSEYPIGYVDARAIEHADRDYEAILDNVRRGKKGFELLSQVKMPARYIAPPQKVQTLREIWHGDILNDVRRRHCEGRIEDIPICRRCIFKDTYRWVRVRLTDEA
jgi:organic radical activating enzyme